MGRKPTAARALEWTVRQEIDVVGVVTDSHLAGSPTTAKAKELGIPALSLEEVYDGIITKRLEFDLAVSVVFWRIIKEPLLTFPRLGIVNFHPAPLPEYKGTAGYNLAILDGLDEWAVTAHYIDAGIDTGGIIDVFRFSIDPEEETAVSLEEKSQAFMLALYTKTIRRIREEGLLETSSNSGGRYISREEMESLRSEERRVGKECRSRWGMHTYKEKKKG